MHSATYDFAIIGQGLAGTTLAWQLHRRGFRVLVLDREAELSASRIAAGLITPVTGKRLAKSWRLDEVYPAAASFYRWVETRSEGTFFHERPSLRLFQNEAERAEYERRTDTIIAGLVREPNEPVDTSKYIVPFGAFEMPTASRLDVARYLERSRVYFRRSQRYLRAELNPEADLELTHAGVSLPRFGITCQAAIFCCGFATECNPWFAGIRFNAAKGEILTVRVPGLKENRVIHRGIWLAPHGDETYRVGSTYVWDDFSTSPTAAARAQIEDKLKHLLRVPFEVIEHEAAVRPVIDAGYPVLGRHPQYPALAYFNGLGSKGSLLAPFFAEQLAGCLCGERQPDPEVDVRKFLRNSP